MDYYYTNFCDVFKVEDKDVAYDDMLTGKNKVNLYKQEGDFVLMKSDGFPTYHFANVVDDHLMAITHVLRGQEWQSSIGKHMLLYAAFNWTSPAYAHLPLINHKDGNKLSKRHGNIDVLSYRDRGILPHALIAYLTTLNGGFRAHQDNINLGLEQFKFVGYTLSQLVDCFDLNHLIVRPIKYDEDLIFKINKQLLKNQSSSEVLVSTLRKLLVDKYQANIDPIFLSATHLAKILKCTVERICTLNELVDESYAYLWTDFKVDKHVDQFDKSQNQAIGSFVDLLIELVEESFADNMTSVQLADFKKQLDLAFKRFRNDTNLDTNLWHLFRLLLCGTKQGPPVIDILQVLGKDMCLYRLKNTKQSFVSHGFRS
jgi:nondiscriminating glutamyl-tRNA synthetase